MNSVTLAYVSLAGAIVCEILGTTFLQKTEQFTRLAPTAAMLVCYTASFFCLSQALKSMPLGIAYALWGGLGIVLTTAVGLVVFRQKLDMAAVVGIGLILSGTLVINLFSKTSTHGG